MAEPLVNAVCPRENCGAARSFDSGAVAAAWLVQHEQRHKADARYWEQWHRERTGQK